MLGCMNTGIPNREAMVLKVGTNSGEQVFLVLDVDSNLQTLTDRGKTSAHHRSFTIDLIK